MKMLLVALAVLITAVVAGHYVAEDPGFIVIGYGGKVIRTSFALFMLGLTLLVIVLVATVNSWTAVRAARRRAVLRRESKRRYKAHQSLADGLVLMASGDYSAAERVFGKHIDNDVQPEAHYLAAASAAAAQRAKGKRDNYLRLAGEVNPDIRQSLSIQRATWLLHDGDNERATPLIERLSREQRGNPEVLKLRMQLAEANSDAVALLEMIPDLRRDRVIDADAAAALERRSAAEVLRLESVQRDGLMKRFKSLPKHLRAETEVMEAYVRGLMLHQDHDSAEALVRKQVERRWDSRLVALYGEIEAEPPARQQRKLEHWSVTRGDDPGLRLARARQAMRAEQWDAARRFLLDLIEVAPSPLLYQLLAQIADATGDDVLALSHRKAGLELATGETTARQLALHTPAADDEPPPLEAEPA